MSKRYKPVSVDVGEINYDTGEIKADLYLHESLSEVLEANTGSEAAYKLATSYGYIVEPGKRFGNEQSVVVQVLALSPDGVVTIVQVSDDSSHGGEYRYTMYEFLKLLSDGGFYEMDNRYGESPVKKYADLVSGFSRKTFPEYTVCTPERKLVDGLMRRKADEAQISEEAARDIRKHWAARQKTPAPKKLSIGRWLRDKLLS